jgi:ABC-type uncharacterized transport system substrate-binding protein
VTLQLRLARFGVVLALSFATSDAAPDRIPRVGVLTSMPPWSAEDGFREGLREFGYVEGKNILIEWRRSREGDEGLEPLAAELVRMKTDVIVTFRTPPTRAALKATSTIPVVFTGVADALQSGLVTSLARPNANATGITLLSTELAPKRLDLLRQLAPRARKVAYLVNRANQVSVPQVDALRKAALALGLDLEIFDVRNAGQTEVAAAVREMQRKAVDALIVGSDAILLSSGAKIAQAVHAGKIPAIFPWREYHEYGVVMSYGPDLRDGLHRGAYYVDRLLKGAKPADLPVEQVSKVELIIDLRAARSMGIRVPETLLYRADQVIR